MVSYIINFPAHFDCIPLFTTSTHCLCKIHSLFVAFVPTPAAAPEVVYWWSVRWAWSVMGCFWSGVWDSVSMVWFYSWWWFRRGRWRGDGFDVVASGCDVGRAKVVARSCRRRFRDRLVGGRIGVVTSSLPPSVMPSFAPPAQPPAWSRSLAAFVAGAEGVDDDSSTLAMKGLQQFWKRGLGWLSVYVPRLRSQQGSRVLEVCFSTNVLEWLLWIVMSPILVSNVNRYLYR